MADVEKFVGSLHSKDLEPHTTLSIYSKLFSFPTFVEIDDVENMVALILQSRQRIFGLDQYLNSANLKFDKLYSEGSNSSSMASDMKSELNKCFSPFPILNFNAIFKNSAKMNLEIGAGAGEWAITQAANDPHTNWITMELRHDRVYDTFLKAMYARLENVCIIGGDALKLIPLHVAEGSIDHVFVNYPEPPQQTGGQNYDSQSAHLLNEVT